MLVEEHAGDLAEELNKIKLVYGDESIPSLFETSRISQKQLPGQPGAYIADMFEVSELEGYRFIFVNGSLARPVCHLSCLTCYSTMCPFQRYLTNIETFTGAVRRAVALGRLLQNPVAMVASLFGPPREILSMKFHPLQSFLSDEELYDVLERVMITVVNQVIFLKVSGCVS